MKKNLFMLMLHNSIRSLAPNLVSNLYAWYSVDSLVDKNDGDLIDILADLSGNNHTAVQAIEIRQPEYKTNIKNGKPGLKFDGTKHLSLSSWETNLGKSPHSFIAVVKRNNGEQIQYFLDMDGSNWCISSSPNYKWGLVKFGGTYTESSYDINNIFAIISGVWTSETDVKLLTNNILENKTDATNYDFNNARIGSRGDGYKPAFMDLLELCVYNRALTTNEIKSIGIYLSRKYEIQINTIASPFDFNITDTKLITNGTAEEPNWYGRPSVCVQDGIVILTYKSGLAHSENDGALHIRFSDNYGETWSDEDKYLDATAITNFPMNPPDCTENQDAQEPYLMIAPNGNLLLHMWRSDYGVDFDGTYQSISTDGGLTWTIPQAIDFIGTDHDLLIFTTDDHFVYDGVIYAGGRDFTGGINTVFVKSTDNGVTWDYVSLIDSGSVEVGLEYLGTNRIVAVLRTASTAQITYSEDMGATWSEPVNNSLLNQGRHRIWTKKHIQNLETWWEDNNLIMCGYVNGRITKIWVSMDRGITWNGGISVDTQTEDCGYSDMFFDPVNSEYVLVGYFGTQAKADIKQYKFTMDGF